MYVYVCMVMINPQPMHNKEVCLHRDSERGTAGAIRHGEWGCLTQCIQLLTMHDVSVYQCVWECMCMGESVCVPQICDWDFALPIG